MTPLRTLYLAMTLALVTSFGLAACSPDVGSKEWCDELKKKPKGDWTAKEAKDFAKNCVL